MARVFNLFATLEGFTRDVNLKKFNYQNNLKLYIYAKDCDDIKKCAIKIIGYYNRFNSYTMTSHTNDFNILLNVPGCVARRIYSNIEKYKYLLVDFIDTSLQFDEIAVKDVNNI